MSSVSRGRLHRVHPKDATTNVAFDQCIVYVPEIRASAVPQNMSWPAIVAATNIHLQVIEFHFPWQESKLPVWQRLIEASDELFGCLDREHEAYSIHGCSTILIGHGFGGTIIKNFLCNLLERFYDPTYRWMRDTLGGVVFLGTPHPTRSRQERWLPLSLILRASLKISGHLLAQAELEAATIARLSEKFHAAMSGIGLPIISIFEQKKTHIGDSFFRGRKQLLVDEDCARIGIETEVLIGCDEHHFSICEIRPGTEAFQQLLHTMATAVLQAQHKEQLARTHQQAAVDRDLTWASTRSERVLSPAEATKMSSDQHIEELDPIDFVDVRVPVKLPCYLLREHARNTHFIGRTTILQLLDEILLPGSENLATFSQHQGIRPFALCGLGGLGKTQTALEFAYSRKSNYDSVFWVQADQANKLDEAFSQIAVDLGLLNLNQVKDRVVGRNSVLSWLSEPHKNMLDVADFKESGEKFDLANWLLVFDNVEDMTIIQDYVPPHGNGAILMTSRNPAAKHYFSPDAGLDLQPLDVGEADAFLKSLTAQGAEDEDAEGSLELVRRVGGLPIAIAHLAGVMNTQNLTFSECLVAYDAEALIQNSRGLGAPRQGSTTQHNLTTVWALESLGTTALCLLQVLSVLDPDTVSEAILVAPNSSEPVLMAEFPSSKSYGHARTELLTSSLIQRNRRGKTLSVHRVVQDVARAKMDASRLEQIFRLAVQLIGISWYEDREWAFGFRTTEWQLADSIVPHIMALKSVYSHRRPSLDIKALQEYASLIRRASTHMYERASFDVCLVLANDALEISEAHRAEMGEEYADSLMSLSSSYGALGDRTLALEYAQRHFDQRIIVERGLGRTPDSELSFEAMGYTALALGLILVGKYEEAIPLCITGRELHERAPGFANDVYWPYWAHAYHAWALIGLGRAAEALPFMQDTIQWRERHFGLNDIDSSKTANALQILGVIHEHQNLPDEALEAFERSLPLYIETEGDSCFRTNLVRVKLAEHYSRLKQPEASRMFFDTALKYFQSTSFYKPETALLLFKKSKFLQNFGDDTAAHQVKAEADRLFFELRPGTDVRAIIKASDFEQLVSIMSR